VKFLKSKKGIALFCAILCVICIGVIVCIALIGDKEEGMPLDAKHGIADQSKLFGMCYLLEERNVNSLNIEKEVELMKNLGVKSVRQWMHFTHFMRDPETIKEGVALTNMHKLLAECEKAGMMNIGMNHHNFCTTRGKASTTAKPFARDISAGSEYVQWLNDYYTSWKTLVAEFPEVDYWEIDNEVNNPDFMTDGGGKGSSSYSVRQMAQIATDMFYYASRAIHEVNPSAQTVMGGLTEPTGLGKGNTLSFLNMLYDNIQSGDYGYFYGIEEKTVASKNADDYFQIACWHPYMTDFNKQHFIDINNEFYSVILKREGKHKKVFFTEFGWNDEKVGGEETSMQFMKLTYEAIKEMPYVETANIFKLFDTGKLNNWDGANYQYFGLIHDPDVSRNYPPIEGNTNFVLNGRCIPGAPKQKAYLYQQLSGGVGDLSILIPEEFLGDNV